MSELGLIADGSLLIDGQKIDNIGSTRRIENLSKARRARVIDVSGKVVAPGFVDSHTRLLSLPSSRTIARELDPYETEARLSGRPAPAPTNSLRNLREAARVWTYRMAACGVTTIEIRLGGEWNRGDPARGLRAAAAVNRDPIQAAAAYGLDAAALRADPVGAVNEAIGLVKRGRRRLAYALEIEAGAPPWPDGVCRAIGDLCRGAGIAVKTVDRSSGGRIAHAAILLGSCSLEGFESDWDDQREADLLAESDVVATLIPEGPTSGSRPHAAVGRGLIGRGAAVCLATGFGGPNRPTLNMAWAMGTACRQMGFTPAEAFTAATLNGAAAMGLAGSIGSLEPGKYADLTVFDVSDYREIPYYLGVNLCLATIKAGRVIYRAGAPPPLSPRASPK